VVYCCKSASFQVGIIWKHYTNRRCVGGIWVS
jgi:hypothetical protein